MHWTWFRITVAVIALSGVVAGFIVNIDRASREQQDLELVLANYFSLFTIVSSISQRRRAPGRRSMVVAQPRLHA